ncbi:sodium bicarbonate cotransporter 3-like [Gigantopelta aegis]|uniref:sodium bicarbonate cotransporter 3-like n=1 Tax=Gigantopelta aegis TaxID=1735272 RepID=UPI001B88C1EE|nr:sodium bicarbonate cotransporter 3-like [Gigantopelta aegis]
MDSTADNGFPIRDQGVTRQISADVDMNAESHRHEAMYIGLRLPHRPRRPRRGSSSHKREKPTQEAISAAASLTPSEQIHMLLSQTEDDDSHETHDVFCQMDYLFKIDTDMQWREMARWVKYEEDVEQGGERWSKPHVASLSLHSLFELRGSLVSGCIILEMDAYNMTQIADLLLDNLINNKQMEESLRDTVKQAILAGHVFQHSSKRRRMSTPDHADLKRVSMKRTFSEFGQKFSIRNRDPSSNQLKRNGSMMRANQSQPNFEGVMNGDLPQSASSARLNQQFMRKIPDGAEAANVMVGELKGLTYQIVAFIRLTQARAIGDLTEVPIPTRFLFLLFGPEGSQQKITEIGRSMSTIMVDEVFREVAYKARNKQDILAGVDEFLDQVTALPPGEWDPKIRIEPPQAVPSQTQRKVPKPVGPPIEEEEEESHCDPTLQRTGRLFGGLYQDIKRKIPFYLSDFKDCLHIQCVASIIYLYLATLTPNVTFGGLLGQATDQYMGTMECILTASIVGVLFALFAGQPLNILGSTGPMLVLEMILYHFCNLFDDEALLNIVYIPMAVLYGVFLYMGVSALKGMQFIDRILLLFMPAKYQPDHIYLRHVPIKRCHLFTFIQIMCLVVLWVVKAIKSMSIIFPIMVLGMCFVRKAMDYLFTQNELKWLDDIMPEDKSKRKEDEKKEAEDDAEKESLLDDENYHKMMEYKIQDDMLAGKFGMDYTRRGSVDPDRVNITEEMAKTAIWKNVAYESRCENEYIKANKRRKEHKDGKEHKPSFYIQDDEREPHQNGHGGSEDQISKV